jgi:hypothetical protein
MPRFSDRIGVTQPPKLTREGMSNELRTALWNELVIFVLADEAGFSGWAYLVMEIYAHLDFRLDEMTYVLNIERRKLSQWWFSDRREWFDIYNVTDFLLALMASKDHDVDGIRNGFNYALESQGSPYRFVGNTLTEIIDPAEIRAIEEAQHAGDQFAGARAHISRGLEFLGQRPAADYRNSIRESIHAVESTLKVLTGLEHADLAVALRAFTKTHAIHGALFSGLDSLYGYTSNEQGIRHALIEADANVGFAEAKFMAVACAAFMNFLIVKDAR